jgi:aminocarboxymuconate-semialdehyde decarboxylase
MLHTCTPNCAPFSGQRRSLKGASRPFTIDVHCHMLTPAVEQAVAETPEKKRERANLEETQGIASVLHNGRVMLPTAVRKMTSLEERLRDMDDMGVDVQIVSPSPTQYYYWADIELTQRLVQLQNDHIAQQCVTHSDRFRAMGTVSLQYPDLACSQLRRCVKDLDMVGVQISSMVNDHDLADQSFSRFWAEAEELDCAIFIHPLGTTLGTRVNDHYLANIIGQPLETTVALSKLILGGVLDRYPKLKLVAAHGGGYLASNIGRLDHGYRVRPETRTSQFEPSQYLKRIWFDTVVYDPLILSHLVKTVGASQLMTGTDYPFDMGIDDVHRMIEETTGLSPGQHAQILGGNAARLFKITIPQMTCP